MGFQEDIANAQERVSTAANGGNILYAKEISRQDRELLIKTDWLKPIIKGWYMISRPDIRDGESSIWYANYWHFLAKYLAFHYGKDYCLSAESSIDMHSCLSTIPAQIIVMVGKGGGSIVKLPFNTSVLPYKSSDIPEDKMEIKGIQIMKLGYALCKVAPSFFSQEPLKLEIALRLIRSPDELLEPILKYSLQNSLNRLIGAYNFLGDKDMSESLENGVKAFGVRILPINPFQHEGPYTISRVTSPYAARLFSIWKSYRDAVIQELPLPRKLDQHSYFSQMSAIYKEDAYNSLSIEGYQVNSQLIEKVRNQQWDPENQQQDMEVKNAMAARGYYEAFQEVKTSIGKVFEGGNAGKIVEKDLSKWYQALFSPSVKAGILKPHDVIGYRKFPVYIRGSRHIPLPSESLLDAMETLYTCIKEEPNAGVSAVLGHFFFGYIHPYMDGNGRIARFLMNFMFAAGGYPWTIIHVQNREEYLSALERASVEGDIVPFAKFIAKELKAEH